MKQFAAFLILLASAQSASAGFWGYTCRSENFSKFAILMDRENLVIWSGPASTHPLSMYRSLDLNSGINVNDELKFSDGSEGAEEISLKIKKSVSKDVQENSTECGDGMSGHGPGSSIETFAVEAILTQATEQTSLKLTCVEMNGWSGNCRPNDDE